jgi:hypothetical protein
LLWRPPNKRMERNKVKKAFIHARVAARRTSRIRSPCCPA